MPPLYPKAAALLSGRAPDYAPPASRNLARRSRRRAARGGVATLRARVYGVFTFWTIVLEEGEKEEYMRALRCRCRRHLEAQDDRALLTALREHLTAEHLGGQRVGSPADELATEILATCAYNLEYVTVPEDNELVPEPY